MFLKKRSIYALVLTICHGSQETMMLYALIHGHQTPSTLQEHARYVLKQLSDYCFCFLALFSLKIVICFWFVMSQAPIYVNKTIVLEDAIKIGYGGRPKSTKPIFNVILDRFFLACLVSPWVITTMCDSLTVANHVVVSSCTALQRDQIPYRRSLN